MAEQDPVKYFKTEIKRLNYYNSQFLVDADFNDEQLYHKQMRRLHNRALHTWGIVEGLQVRRAENENKVTVAPGVAIDRLGQEIVLPKRSAPIGFDAFEENAQVYVTIRYRDVQDADDKDTSDNQTEGERYKRWTERPEVSASATEPAPDAPDVLLAVVELDKRAVKQVVPSRRRYAGSRIGATGDDDRELVIHADGAGAWHFFDGGANADRLTIDGRGNVGIGAAPTAARLSVLTNPGPYDGALMDFMAGGGVYRLSLRSKAPARDTVSYHFDLVNNLGRFDDFLVFDRGNVGVGAKAPTQKLQVGGTIHSESGGFMFPDGTTQATAAGSARIPAENVAAGSFGASVGGGAYTFPAALYWGNLAARTETKDDAGAQASKSGFFETQTPTNYYAGAKDWQHLIEARHSNNANNYALQIAGSFFDQNLYMRKTNGSGTTAWSQFILANSGGNVGIGVQDSSLRLYVKGGDKLVQVPGTYQNLGNHDPMLYSLAGSNPVGVMPGDWVVLGDRSERRQVESAASVGVRVKGAFGAPRYDGTLYVVRPGNDIFRVDDWKGDLQFLIMNNGNVGIGSGAADTIKLTVDTRGGTNYSLKCEHRGSNFMVRPESAGSSSTVIENTGGGHLLVNPGGAGVKFGGSISCGGRVGFKTYHGTYVNANADKTNMRQAGHFDIHEQFTLEMACSREYKENISDLTAAEALDTLRALNPVKYDYRAEKAFRPNLGFIAEEMPDNLASADRKSISPFEVIPVLTRVAKEQHETIAALEENLRALQEELRRRDAPAA